uniref:GNAT family N-acetyltransferase n=1 Tax=Escherichia coli TaxID=562 RepID=UPI003207D4E1
MDENALGFASYWRNSLADAESGKGSFERKDAKNFTHWHGIAAGKQLVAKVVEKMRREKRKIIPLCPFAKHEFDKTREYDDIRS